MNIPELDELYALYRADLYRYLCRLTRDPAAAEDLLSETFLRALKGAVTFRGESDVKTWLFTIARNAWCESLRRQRPTVSTEELLTAQYLADGGDGDGCADGFAGGQTADGAVRFADDLLPRHPPWQRRHCGFRRGCGKEYWLTVYYALKHL